MNKLQKIYWKSLNAILAPVLRLWGNKGLLPHRKDKRDRIARFGGSFYYKTKQKTLEFFAHQYHQINNICVFASGILGLSEQTGIRWSVRFAVKLARKLGYTSGNGFSSQRALLKIVTKYGLVPYEDCPDEDMSNWNEYSKWTERDQFLLDNIAPLYKFEEYTKLTNEGAVLEALDNGYRPVTANGWYSDMNNPKHPFYVLKALGRYIGGHAFRLIGYRARGIDIDEIVMNTFGENYGDKGKAYIETSFAKGYFETYIFENNQSPMLPTELVLPLFLMQNKGKLVRSKEKSACYVIEEGQKRWVSGADEMKTFWALEKEKGLTYVNNTLLEAVPRGEDYPLI